MSDDLTADELAELSRRIEASIGSTEHPVGTERLKAYWAEGEGAAKILWNTPGDYDRCLVEVGKYVPARMLHGYCQEMHIRATGFPAGKAPGDKAGG